MATEFVVLTMILTAQSEHRKNNILAVGSRVLADFSASAIIPLYSLLYKFTPLLDLKSGLAGDGDHDMHPTYSSQAALLG